MVNIEDVSEALEMATTDELVRELGKRNGVKIEKVNFCGINHNGMFQDYSLRVYESNKCKSEEPGIIEPSKETFDFIRKEGWYKPEEPKGEEYCYTAISDDNGRTKFIDDPTKYEKSQEPEGLLEELIELRESLCGYELEYSESSSGSQNIKDDCEKDIDRYKRLFEKSQEPEG